MTGLSRRLRWLTLGAVLAGGSGWMAGPASAQSPLQERADKPPATGTPGAYLSPNPESANLKLGFYNVSWSSVLKKIAEKSDKTLVMDKVPPGRFTRRDSREYSLTQAVQVLNRELEKDGFRLLVKGDFLVVLHLPQARSEYYRSEFPAQHGAPGKSTPTQAAADENVQRYKRRFEALAIPPRETDSAKPAAENGIRQVSHSIPETPAAPAQLDSQAQDVDVVRVVEPRHSARDIARTIFAAHRENSQLIDAGPRGLPAFQVMEPSDDDQGLLLPDSRPDVRFTIGIDVNQNRLVIEAQPDVAMDTARMIRALDQMQLREGQSFKLVAATDEQLNIAQQLKPQVNRLIAQAPGQPGGGSQPDVQLPAATGPLTEEEAAILLDSLRGNVEIEVVPGGLILKGNQADIDALMRVINQIERFSRGAVPSIHILLLKNVNSESLSQLMTNVYQQLNTLQARDGTLPQRIAFLPVVRPNALVVLAPDQDMQAILELADELDQPVGPETEFEVFYLKYAVASLVATRLNEFYGQQTPGQAAQNFVGLAHRITAFADVRTNSVIVRGSGNDLNEVAALIQKLDQTESQSVSRVQMFVLKHAVAEELANVINTTIQSILGPPGQSVTSGQAGGFGAGATGQLPQDLQEAKSLVLEFLNDSEAGVEMVRSGLLADIRVSIDARTNAVIVSAPESSMPLMEALIRRLDQPSATIAEIRVFTLENADATGMSELLETLFNQDAAGDDGSGLQVQIAGAEDASSSLVPLRFSVDVRTNTIVAVGGAEALRVVEAILLRLDQSDMRLRQSSVVRLKNAPVADVATAVNQFLTSQRELAQLDPELTSNVQLLEQEVIVVPEAVNNSLLISATPRYYDSIMELILKLDEAPAQVIIQALLVEVELDNTDEFGVELGFQDSILFNRSLIPQEFLTTVNSTILNASGQSVQNTQIISADADPGFLFNNTSSPLGNNLGPGAPINKGRVGTQGLSNFSLGRTNSELGYGGLVLSASSDSVSVLLRALSAQRTVHVLSRPQIRTIDNQFSQIIVGQTIQWIQGFQANNVTGTFAPQTAPQNVGIILQVTPRISPDGTIVMETHAEKSRINNEEAVPLVFDPATGTQIESPVIDVTIADTTVAVPSGQTAVIGGMITTSDATIERKVPWLGDIPVIGIPFRFDSASTTRTELLIFLTPRIIHNDEDAEMIKQIESERLHFIVEEAESIHGPIFSLPAGMAPAGGMQVPGGSMNPPPPAPAAGDLDEGTPSSSITPDNTPRLMPVQNTVPRFDEDQTRAAIESQTGRNRLPALTPTSRR